MALNKPHHTIIAALDIGTTKVVCFIASIDNLGEVTIQGIGHQVSHGTRSGIVTDIKAAEHSILNAVHSAEQMAGVRIEEVVVNLSGGQLQSHNIHVDMPLSGQPVTRRDAMKLIDVGREKIREPERDIIHCIPVQFNIDEAQHIKDPVGMYGRTLGVDLHLITASATALKNLIKCVSGAQLDISDFLVSSYASGFACLTEDEMQLGVTLLDIGGGTTSAALFLEGKPIYTDLVPYGGHHITKDIASGLSTSIQQAERIKALYGSVYAAPADDREMLDIPQIGSNGQEMGESQQIARSMLSGIIRPRTEEILEMIRDQLKTSPLYPLAGRRMVLTGGGSQLIGVDDLAGKVFGKQVRIAKPKYIRGAAESMGGGAFATCVGLIDFKARQLRDLQRVQIEEYAKPQGVLARAVQKIREFI